jgi:hypothetical protein
MGTTRLFVAGGKEHLEAVRAAVTLAREAGIEVVSSWHDPDGPVMARGTLDGLYDEASLRRKQIALANALVAIAPDGGDADTWMSVEAARLRGASVFVVCPMHRLPLMGHATGLMHLDDTRLLGDWLKGLPLMRRTA